MGHGKTSFTNTLILPKNYLDKEIPEHLKDKMLQAGAKMKSITV
jgi:hypothetical protein